MYLTSYLEYYKSHHFESKIIVKFSIIEFSHNKQYTSFQMNSRVALLMFLIFTILAYHECRVNRDSEETKIGISNGFCVEQKPCYTAFCYCCYDTIINCYITMSTCRSVC
ncbi:hypothetical protein RND81_02G064700 [Saponaria officinalis]|uniref:Uncharacterized protein n=1 Tax=Saponaria officinalis TaxID=3572 RepID=A0AAW1ML14_SAPOF